MAIVIHTDADLTPAGKRKALLVHVQRGKRYATGKGAGAIRWYVGGRIYHQLAATAENAALTNEWLAAQ